ncbi:MAG TPA: S49 family peptidase, partial [Tepidisphaeraceae bacterium]|nr:S49 family peptidase [Tepidisphaeraceae bacterium]
MQPAFIHPHQLLPLAAAWFLTILTAAGCSPPSVLLTPVFDSPKLKEQTVQSGRFLDGSKIAIIEVEGLLMNARAAGGIVGARENRLSLFTQQLERAETDRKVKAVVLRINSPGGTVTCSDAMYELVQRFKKRTGKPVIASFQEVAASGAYYVACAADTVVAQPSSVCGSIGVIFSSFNLEGTMNLIGVKPETVKSGRLKDMASPFKPLEGEERKIVQEMI